VELFVRSIGVENINKSLELSKGCRWSSLIFQFKDFKSKNKYPEGIVVQDIKSAIQNNVTINLGHSLAKPKGVEEDDQDEVGYEHEIGLEVKLHS